ncbi:MAG: dipeptidase [Patescibacteria group bacterium]|nr:dipeptidase [Patescibacteria group bacterium]
MKLLLTSNGLSNQIIAEALFDLVGKKPENTSLVFISTASNMQTGDKNWFIDDLVNIQKQNFKTIKITDIINVPENIWRPQLEEADVLFFEGGSSSYLMECMSKLDFKDTLVNLLQNKVYVGVSAGSMVTGPDLDLTLSQKIYGKRARQNRITCLGLVDFYILPHLNSPHFAERVEDNIKEVMKDVSRKTYVLDDQSALKVVDGVVEIIGGGKYLEFN